MCKSCLEYSGGVELTVACVYDTVNEPAWLTHQAASAAPFFFSRHPARAALVTPENMNMRRSAEMGGDTSMSVTLNRARHPKLKRTLRSIVRNWDLYLLLVPVLAYFIIFHYAPMYGVQIAFRRYSIRKGILGSQWVGMAHFNRFFQSYYFERLLVNTLTISLYNLALGFPLPILLALLLNEVTSKRYKKLVQTITYAPHFLSAVVLVSIINAMFSTSTGIITT